MFIEYEYIHVHIHYDYIEPSVPVDHVMIRDKLVSFRSPSLPYRKDLPRFFPNFCVISVQIFSRALLSRLILLNWRDITVLTCAG